MGDINAVWLIVSPFVTLAVKAWVGAVHNAYKEAVADGDFTWWEKRGLFILLFTSIPAAVQNGFKDFPFGTLIAAIIKFIKK
jgi:hypothetical protein